MRVLDRFSYCNIAFDKRITNACTWPNDVDNSSLQNAEYFQMAEQFQLKAKDDRANQIRMQIMVRNRQNIKMYRSFGQWPKNEE